MKFFASLFCFVFAGSSAALAASATAHLEGTAQGSNLSGKVEFEETAEGLKIQASVFNVPPGKHGFHIHEFGSCADSGKAAGGHFNPENAPHGLLAKDGFTRAHAGDLGNIEVSAEGGGQLDEALISGLSLTSGKYNVTGKAVILHAKEDDFGQPVGNAGDRIGCGIITLNESV